MSILFEGGIKKSILLLNLFDWGIEYKFPFIMYERFSVFDIAAIKEDS